MAIYKEDIVDIELRTGSIHRSFLNHSIGSGDALANRYGVRIFRDGEPVSVESNTVTGVFMAPDGTNYAITETNYPGSTGKTGNVAFVQLPGICYAARGQFCLAIKLNGGSVNGTMRIVDGTVDETGEDSAVVPTSTIPSTADIIAAYEDAVAVIDSSVRFDVTQDLTANQKEKARQNIGSASQSSVDAIDRNDQLYRMLKKGWAIVSPDLVANAGKGWDSTGSLVTDAERTAWEFPAAFPYYYTVIGLRISNDGYPVLFLDSDGDIIDSITGYTDPGNHVLKFPVPEGTAKVRYTSYTNSTWDKPPVKEYIPEYVDNYKKEIMAAYDDHTEKLLQKETETLKIPVELTVQNGDAYGNIGTPVAFTSVDYWKRAKINNVTAGEKYIVRIIRTAARGRSDSKGYVVFVDENEIVVGSVLNQDITDSLSKDNLVVIPDGVAAIYVNSFTNVDARLKVYKVTDEYNAVEQTAKKNKNDIIRIAKANNSHEIPQKVDMTQTSGKVWDNDGTLVDNANGMATQFSAEEFTKYRVTGLRTGIDYPILFQNENGDIIHYYLPNAQGSNYTVEFVTPKGCTTVKYSSYANANWDKFNPVKIDEFSWIPGYYYENNYMDDKINEIREATKFINGVAFIFITDIHYEYNAKNSLYLMKDIMNKTTVPFVICGGDIPAAYGTEQQIKDDGERFVQWQNYIGKDKFFTVRGNHDFTVKTNSSMETRAPNTGATLPTKYTVDYVEKSQERFLKCSDPENMAWFIDIQNQKTRIIGVNSCDGQLSDTTASWGVNEAITQKQMDWILENAVDKTDYRYIFISHITSDPNMGLDHTGQDSIQALIEAMKNHTAFSYSDATITASKDFTEYECDVICHISGHAHEDTDETTNNVLSIITTCDAYYIDDGHGAVRGTITEHAFDVFCIDYDAETIKAVRVGRGNTRTWNY